MLKMSGINSLRLSVLISVLTGMSAFMMAGCADMQTMPAQTQPVSTSSNEAVMALHSTEATSASVVTPVVRPPVVNDRNVSLTDLNMNNQGNQITIKPGKTVQATLSYVYHCSKCKSNLGNQIIVGLAKRSAQACIYNGGLQGQGMANFSLKVPAKPGRYDVRYRGLQAMDCDEALKAGWSAEDTPSRETTIGTITVSRKALV